MKKNRITLLILVVLVLVALVLLLTRSDKTFNRELSGFAVDDSATVTRIFMADKNNNSVLLSRTPEGTWLVNEKYPASKHNMDMLLGTMLNLAIKEPVAQAAHNTVIRDLAVASVKVEIYQRVYRINLFDRIHWFPHEKLTRVYYVGGATQSNRGTYMLMDGSSKPFVVFLPGLRGFVSPRFQPIEKYWRDYSVFKLEIPAIRSVQVEIPGRENESYTVTNNGNRSVSMFTFPENQPVNGYDTLAVMNFLSGFRNLNVEAIITEMEQTKRDSILASKPFLIMAVTDTSGQVHTVKTFFKPSAGETDMDGNPIPYDLDRLYALVNNGEDFVIIQYFAFDKVLRPRSFFLPE